MTLFDEIQPVVDALNHMSRVARFRADLTTARETDRRRCGNCEKWMKSRECPQERNVNGYSRGPSADSPKAAGCDLFELKQWVRDLKDERMANVRKKAEELGIELPSAGGL